ncbi:hypothetical protein LTR56_002800 [Elasticomyces elasticus]|nr:hypothetical protein LTR56_002800 [Elasticomyces elasticus]KAK3666743.1 hypothetical protein LTR22_002330 [Elasticomyces elasticus]KAK4920414.1 hypothetical protein LTR49_012006 [Elasticomyces elasticus]KAK5759298.1 hypothetical protein LTS12_010621 [Elasticomyces elasticus]
MPPSSSIPRRPHPYLTLLLLLPCSRAHYSGSSDYVTIPNNTTWHGQAIPSQSVSDASLSKSTSQGVGEYVAQGMSLTASTSDVVATNLEQSITTSMVTMSTTGSDLAASSSALPQANSNGNSTVSHIFTPSARANTSMLSNTSGQTGNGSLCWDQWSTYWSEVIFASTWLPNVTDIPTKTETVYETGTAVPGTTYTTSTSFVVTSTVYQGVYPISTKTSTSVYATTFTQTDRPADTATYIETELLFSTISGPVPISGSITPPPCALPSYVPQCQSSWLTYLDDYASSRRAPLCQAATINDPLCWSFRDAYVDGNTYYNSKQFGDSSKGYTFTSANSSGSYVWPTGSTLAPSCTLGCARCAMTGGSIELLYWPAGKSYQTATGPILVSTDDTTLTYPTVYISYSKIFASDKCNAVGPTITNTIVAVPNSKKISSIYASITYPDLDNMINSLGLFTTSFDMADLQATVAPEVYSRQPWCVSALAENAVAYINGSFYDDHAGTGPTMNYSCPTTAPYKPLLYLPSELLQSMDSDWATCSGDINGVYDPPKALTPVAIAAQATVLTVAATTSAVPVSSAPAPTPAQTEAASGAQETGAGSSSQGDPVVVGTPSIANEAAQATAGVHSSDPTGQLSDASESPTSVDASSQDPTVAQQTLQSSASADGASTASGVLDDPTIAPSVQPGSSDNQQTTATTTDDDPAAIISILTNIAATSAADPRVATTNALSVLSSAGLPTTTNGGSSQSLDSSGDQVSGVVTTAAHSTVQAAPSDSTGGPSDPNGISIGASLSTVVAQTSTPDPSSAIIVANGGSTESIAPGVLTSLGGQEVSAQDGTLVFVSSDSVIAASHALGEQAVTTALGSQAGVATSVQITASNGQVLDIQATSSIFQIVASGSTYELVPGQQTVVVGQTISAGLEGIQLIVDASRTISLDDPATVANAGATVADAGPTVTGTNGDLLHITQANDGNLAVIADGTSTVSLIEGQETVFEGRTFSAAASNAIVVDTTQTVEIASSTSKTAELQFTGTNGEAFSVVETDGRIEAIAATETVSLVPGKATVIAGETISVAPDNSHVFVDGSGSLTTTPDPGQTTTPNTAYSSTNSPDQTTPITVSAAAASRQVLSVGAGSTVLAVLLELLLS